MFKKSSTNTPSLKNKNVTYLKNFYKKKVLTTFLLKNSLKLFFLYELMSKTDLNKLKNLLNKESLKSFQIKKNLLLKDPFLQSCEKNFLNNIIKNNVILITSEKNVMLKDFDYKIIQEIQTIKQLHFLGGIIDYKFYRPSEFKKASFLQKINVEKNVCNVIKYNQNFLKNVLVLKKCC